MKILWLVIVSAGLGVALGVGTGWARVGWEIGPPRLTLASFVSDKPAVPPPADGSQPQAVVDDEEFDFGSVTYDKSVEHTFVIRNAGTAPLTLESGGTSCSKCTVSSLSERPIPPGEAGEVHVKFNPSPDQSDFRQYATVITNDPERKRIELTVMGKVVIPVRLKPNQVVFSRLSASEGHTAKVELIAFFDPDFAITSTELSDPETAKYFDVAIEPLPAAEIATLDAKRGYVLTVTVKPGIPLGPLRQNLVLHTNGALTPTLNIPIEGTVDSDVSITGAGFNRETGILNVGPVDRRQGFQRDLLVLIRGERRHDVHVTVGSCEPPSLQATLGEPSDLSSGAVVKVPLTVKVAPGAPVANHLVNPGKILLETDHPAARQIRIWVQFAVEE